MSELMAGTAGMFLKGYRAAIYEVLDLVADIKKKSQKDSENRPVAAKLYEDAYTYLERKINKLYTGDDK